MTLLTGFGQMTTDAWGIMLLFTEYAVLYSLRVQLLMEPNSSLTGLQADKDYEDIPSFGRYIRTLTHERFPVLHRAGVEIIRAFANLLRNVSICIFAPFLYIVFV